MLVLIVDDDNDILEVLEAVVRRAGFEVATAHNGQEALQFLEGCTEPPRVILLDMSMPEMDGWEFLAARPPEMRAIPVLVLSARHDLHVPSDLPVLRKPVTMEALLAALVPYARG
jgi:CheY-like chemotaxis protein